MKYFILILSLMFAAKSWSAACEEMIKNINPQGHSRNPVTTVGKMQIYFGTPMSNPAASCSISVSYPEKNKTYIFSDDGMVAVSEKIRATGRDSQDTRFRSYMLLPQEKQKNFTATRDGKMLRIRMNSGEFAFDTEQGKIVPSSSLDISDTADGIKINQPKALWVDFGTAIGNDPRSKPGISTVYNGTSSCQFKKEQIFEKVKWDQVMKLHTSSEQINYFKKNCVGTKFNIATKQKVIDESFRNPDDARDFTLPADFGKKRPQGAADSDGAR